MTANRSLGGPQNQPQPTHRVMDRPHQQRAIHQKHDEHQHKHQHQHHIIDPKQQQQQPPVPGSALARIDGDDPLLPSSTLVYCALGLVLVLRYMLQQKEAKFVEKLKQINLRQMPTPRSPAMPIIGHIYLMRNYQHNPWEGFTAIRAQSGDLVSLKMGVHPMVLISNFDYMNEVLIRKGNIFADRPTFPRHHIIFGGDKEHSLALCNWSETHRARRKFCKRGVVPNKLSARNQLLERIISEVVGKFVCEVASRDRGRVAPVSRSEPEGRYRLGFDVSRCTNPKRVNDHGPWFSVDKKDLLFLTGDIFMRFLCNQGRPHSDPAYDDFNFACDYIFYDMNQCYLMDFLPHLTPYGLGRSYLDKMKAMTDFCRQFIDDNIYEPRLSRHREAWLRARAGPAAAAARGEQDSQDSGTTGAQLSSPIDIDLDDEDSHDYLDSIIRDQIEGACSMSPDDYKVGFADLLAGHSAVTNILMRVLGYLALNPSYQEMIYEEARRTKLLSLDQTPPLPVSDAALKEALRLASSPIVPHVAREDSSIGEFYVPRGSVVLFNCYYVNLSPELWDEPRLFKPCRFLKSSVNSLGEISYKLELPKYFTPFSAGQRQCLGFKMVESITIDAVARICASFKIQANDDALVERLLEPKGTVALDPLEECFKLRLTPR